MEYNIKIILLAKFFSKERIEGCVFLDRLFQLDDIWQEAYKKHRLESFSIAREMANKQILLHVLSDDYN